MTRHHYLIVALFILCLSWSGRDLAATDDPAPTKAGNHVQWEGWDFHWSVRPREGLVITDVAFKGRSVLKFASLAEIFVPYNRGQPRPDDFGSGIGNRLIELFPGKDCVPGSTS